MLLPLVSSCEYFVHGIKMHLYRNLTASVACLDPFKIVTFDKFSSLFLPFDSTCPFFHCVL